MSFTQNHMVTLPKDIEVIFHSRQKAINFSQGRSIDYKGWQ